MNKKEANVSTKERLSIQQIREELREVRYYYSKQKMFESMEAAGIKNKSKQLADKYNKAMENAPIKLFDLYIALYIQNNTQLVVAEDLGYVIDYVRQLNRQLYIYLQGELARLEEENA